jgi:lysophospholipase L1-like esterase
MKSARPFLTALLVAAPLALPAAAAEENRWEPDIRKFEARDRQTPPPPNGIVFVGSSSIRHWDTQASFPDLPVINRGFGGSKLADSVIFADRIVTVYKPKLVVLYAGGHDLLAGKKPADVAALFGEFVNKVRARLPQVKIVYISLNPTPKVWSMMDTFRESNRLIQAAVAKDTRLDFVDTEAALLGADGKPRPDLFIADGVHLSAEGYKIWTALLRPHLKVD